MTLRFWILLFFSITAVRCSVKKPNRGILALPNLIQLDDDGQIVLAWEANHETEQIVFEIEANTTGYVGIGISPQGSMLGSDIFISGIHLNGTSYSSDRFGIGFTTPKIDEHEDWTLLNATESNGRTYLKFSRLFNTCDDEDYPITIDTTRLIWAMGLTDAIEYHSTRRGARSIGLLGAPTPEIDLDEIEHWDMTLEMAMPSTETTYWCSFHKAPILNKKHHIVAFDAVLDNAAALKHTHHYILYNCNTKGDADAIFGNATVDVGNNGNNCYGPNSSSIPHQYCKEYLFVWAKGGKMMVFPENVGYPLAEGAEAGVQRYYMLEHHFDNPDKLENVKFETGTRVYYTDNLRPIDAGLITVGHQVDASLTVPPNTKEYVAIGHCSPTCTNLLPISGLTIFNALLHSHISGRKLKLRHFRGSIELPWIDFENHYDFDYQQNKHLTREVKILPGDQLTYECTYDSTWKNGVIVSGGMTTTDEMCESFLWYYPKNARDIDHCISHYNMRQHMTELGVTTYHKDQSSGFPLFIIDGPPSLAGLYDDSISFKFNWTSEFQTAYTERHRFGGHEARCTSKKTGESITVQNQQYPVNLVEYVPEDYCASKQTK